MNDKIQTKLKNLPNNPGCYLMKDIDGAIIYVGKAKNLKNRVSSYFTGSHNAKTTLLVNDIDDFDYIITASELESFILEINLIKNHLPKYNIKLVDDASYPYILLTKEKHPRIIAVREDLNKKKGSFFGPYPNVKSARDTINLLNQIYPFRKCYKIPKKECLYYHMGQCLAPCINKEKIDYEPYINNVTKFLKGDNKEVLENLKKKMNEASLNLQFEKAISYRELINSINKTTEKQKIFSSDLQNRDIIGLYQDNNELSIEILFIRLGSIVQNYITIIPIVYNLEETLLSFLAQFYEAKERRPKEIVIDDILDKNILEDMLGLEVIIPLKGRKKELLLMANKNAENNYRNSRLIYENKVVKRQENIYELGNLLGIKPPIRIEAFDNSNLFGTYPVSAMVCYINGVKEKSEFRKYHIKTVVGANDYASMKEVIYRRYLRLQLENKPLPDLIIMDGGEIQVNACLETLAELNLNINVMGLKKDDTHQTNIIVYQDKNIPIKKNSSLYIFLANIQQTVHDYAISFFRSQKGKGMFSSMLDGIKGLGPKKKEKILASISSLEDLKKYQIEDYKALGINEDIALSIMDKIKEKISS